MFFYWPAVFVVVPCFMFLVLLSCSLFCFEINIGLYLTLWFSMCMARLVYWYDLLM